MRTACAVLLLGSSALAQSGGIEIFSGETIFYDGTRVSLSHLYDQQSDLYQGSGRVDNPNNQESSRQRVVLGYTYGVSARFTVGALLPFVDPQFSEEIGGTRIDSGTSGIGDTSLFGKYRLYTHDRPMNSRNLSVIAGVETPTGRTGLDGPQPGSGSWDPFLALAFTESIARWRLDAVALYKWNTEGTGGIDEGEEFSMSASVGYRYLHRPYPGVSNSAKLGLLYQGQETGTRNGTLVANSGSERLYLRPSLGFHPNPAIDITVAVDFPLSLDYDGTQLGDEFRTFVAFGYRF